MPDPTNHEPTNFERAMDYAVRSDPYARYAELRATPIERQPDGSYVVSSYDAVQALYHDPRVTSDMSKRAALVEKAKTQEDAPHPKEDLSRLDPPRHDRLRSLAFRHFGPPNKPRFVYDLQGALGEIVDGLIDRFDANGGEIDLIEQFAFPFPVEVIVKLLGVPQEDKPRIAEWGHILSNPVIDPDSGSNPLEAGEVAINKLFLELNEYMAELLEKHRTSPGDDMLSNMMSDDGPDGRMDDDDLIATATLLLTAGHETTVNLIGNSSLLLLRRPDLRERVVNEPEFVIRFVEEVLRFESPVQYLPQRSALVDIDMMGTTIPKGSPIVLMLGVANRDERRFPNADTFDADRTDNQHLGFGSGIHNCMGAALARREAHIALVKLFSRLKNPRLIADPTFRKNAGLRGPEELRCAFDGVEPAS
jgi:cytochrome P450